MSRQAEARERQTAATFPCANRCGTADFRVEFRTLEPKHIERVAGVDKLVEPYASLFLCEPCCKRAVVSPDPPRKVDPLPHMKARLATAVAEERKAVRKTRAANTDGRLGDWGKR